MEKILKDSREIFGDLPVPPPSLSDNSNPSQAKWMSRFPDDMPITQLNIPGTHDSATWDYSQETQNRLLRSTSHCSDEARPHPAAQYRCQRQSLASSLEAGIRFFDLRIAMDPLQGDLTFWHAEALLSTRTRLEDVLFGFYTWLSARPSETVLLSLMYEHGGNDSESTAASQRLLFNILTSDAARQYISQRHGDLGTLGDSRGKIILFRRFDLDLLAPSYDAALPGIHLSPKVWVENGPDFALTYNVTTGATALIEDYYYPVEETPFLKDIVNAKFAAVRNHLDRAAKGDTNELFITFTSATRPDVAVYPEMIALGSKSERVSGVNERLVDYFQRDTKVVKRRRGIVITDFYEQFGDLVELVIGS
ncbi:PLC-like phosphodiesterase [Xylariaceae sp. FL0255]|nr:PLC-like phosphodiesterase [Xylariaceae sp. FL0255]